MRGNLEKYSTPQRTNKYTTQSQRVWQKISDKKGVRIINKRLGVIRLQIIMPKQIARITRAVPRSGCLKTKANGIKTINNPGSIGDLSFPKSKYVAREIIVINLANSDGWKVIGPKESHLWAPWEDVPKKSAARRRTIIIT